MNTYGVIMAGGGGTRFWPLSRMSTPKQLLNISGKDLMINETLDRLNGVIEESNRYIVTNVEQAASMKDAVGTRVPCAHILQEPVGRNTAACIGYAAMKIWREQGDGIMCVFPSDHYIKELDRFHETLALAIDAAREGGLITIGIRPTYPATGYGYIRYSTEDTRPVTEVIRFVEKPDLQKACAYVDSGDYLWNSGMFIWKVSAILSAIEKHLPELYTCLELLGNAMGTDQESAALDKLYPIMPSISIDYGILEKSDSVRVVPGEFGWNDVGSWDAMEYLHETDAMGNVIVGEQINIETENCVSFGGKKLIATLGVKDLVIVETADAIMVCDKNRAQDIRLIVDELKHRGLEDYIK